METKEMICIVCPVGCRLKVDVDGSKVEVSGNKCMRGKVYGTQEVLEPKRMLTSTVKVVGGNVPRCSIISRNPVPKGKIFDMMNVIRNTQVSAPVSVGDVIISNICDSGVDMVATRSVDVDDRRT